MKEIIYLEIEDDYHHLGKCILNRLECENSSIVSLLHRYTIHCVVQQKDSQKNLATLKQFLKKSQY